MSSGVFSFVFGIKFDYYIFRVNFVGGFLLLIYFVCFVIVIRNRR